MSIIHEVQKNVPDCTYHANIGLGGIIRSLEQYKVDLDPDYQRDHVWTDVQESKFVGAFIENPKSIPPFWFNWLHTDGYRSCSEIVDGKQRITACIKWHNGEIKALCPCGRIIHISDLDEVDLRGINMGVLMDWNFVDLNRIEVMRFYLRLNDGGTVHTEKELEKVKDMINEFS